MFRPRLRAPRIDLVRQPLRRAMHFVPPLGPEFRNGVPGLFSAGGVKMAYYDYQALMLERLNAAIAGKSQYQGMSELKRIIEASAREPSQAHIFNYASMAHNNHFFFNHLSHEPVTMPEAFKKKLEECFGSIETLRREFLVTANAMFGPGFVWLVKAKLPHSYRGGDNYYILTTYLAGSPYAAAHWRRQSVDMNTVGGASPEAQNLVKEYLSNQAGALNQGKLTAQEARRPPGGVDVTPLLCVNTWEHVWLFDYLIESEGKGGKRAFLEAWWDRIHWEKVADLAGLEQKHKLKY